MTRIFEPVNLREGSRWIGHWVPISFSAFREYDRTFTLNMISCSMNNNPIDYLFGQCTNESFFFPKVEI